jgi:homoserine O-succinyltransferase/O-acetyltransferase
MALLSLDSFRRRPARAGAPLAIGLVNNMPDAALKTTELQVRDLLARAAGDMPVSLRVFSLPEVPRGEAGLAHAAKYHEPISVLWHCRIAGLIITGAEPKALAITDEPYWSALARLIDWAEDHTVSTIFSCLASHAAAYRLDGIERRPLSDKLSGVFAFDKATEHPLVAGRRRWLTPHSRQNELSEEDLAAAGYRILARSPEAGIDIFLKQRDSLFVFLQGHPEYDATALFGEYRRDVRRFLHGERDTYPELPHGYFTCAAQEALLEFRARALDHRDGALLQDFPSRMVDARLSAPWRADAAGLYANWLGYLAEGWLHRSRRRAQQVAPARCGFNPTYA